MKKFASSQNNRPKEKEMVRRIALHGGSYSLAITAIVLAILIVVNMLVSALPTTLTKYDISAAKLYSITSNTKVVVNALEKDVTIYWVVQSDKEDDILENLLNKYESLSDHIEVVKKNPDVFPTFTAQYTSESVPNNSLIVECGDRNRYISFQDIYLTETNMMNYSYEQYFDGEGAITSAIDYVVNEEQPQLYLLEGHGEAELPTNFGDQLAKENVELNTISLLNVDEVPEEADCVMIYAPSSDISEEEKEMLIEYAENGGKLLVMAGPTADGKLENLYGVLEEYGVTSEVGMVVEGDRQYYAFQTPIVLLPDIASHESTTPLSDEGYYAIVPAAQALTLEENGNGTVTELLTTSVTSYNKADGYNLATYEKEDEDAEGPFAVAVAVECGHEGKIVWISSSNFIDDLYNAYSSGANMDMTMNAMSYLVGENEAVAIRCKSLNYSYLTISDSFASVLKIVMIGVVPLGYLLVGLFIALKRRLRNETV